MKKRVFSVLIVSAMAFTFVLSPLSVSATTKVKLNKANVTIAKGTSYSLKLNGAKAKKVKWSSKNSKIVKVLIYY